MMTFLSKIGKSIMKLITGILMRFLVFITLTLSVLSCIIFVYGLYTQSYFYCIFGCIGAVVFTWLNKQT